MGQISRSGRRKLISGLRGLPVAGKSFRHCQMDAARRADDDSATAPSPVTLKAHEVIHSVAGRNNRTSALCICIPLNPP
jgi:hypothetical protein